MGGTYDKPVLAILPVLRSVIERVKKQNTVGLFKSVKSRNTEQERAKSVSGMTNQCPPTEISHESLQKLVTIAFFVYIVVHRGSSGRFRVRIREAGNSGALNRL